MRRGVGAELARIAGKELQAGGCPRDLDGDDRAVASGLRIPQHDRGIAEEGGKPPKARTRVVSIPALSMPTRPSASQPA